MSAKVAQKTAQSSKPDKPKASSPAHPPFKQMIVEAIKYLNEPNGASRKAIRKVIGDKYEPKNMSTFLNKNLAKMVESGKLEHPKKFPGKYVINEEKTEKKPKKTQKKKVAQKPKADKKPKKKASAQKKAKSPAKKQKVKSAKKAPAKKAALKKAKGPPSPKKSASKGKKGRGRPKK